MNALDQIYADRRVGTVPNWTQQRNFLFALMLVDVVALASAFALSYAMRYSLQLEIFQDTQIDYDFYVVLVAALTPVWLILFALFQLYDPHQLLGGTKEYGQVLNACTVGTMLIVLTSFFGKVILSRGWLVLFWLFSIIFVGVSRFAMRRVVYALRRRGLMRIPTVVVGADAEGRAIAHQLQEAQTCGANIIGFLDDDHEPGDTVDGKHILGKVAQLKQIVECFGVEEILLSTNALTRSQVVEIYEEFGSQSNVELRLSPGLFEILTTGARVKEWGMVPLVSVNRVRLDGIETLVKTVMDYGLTLIGLIVLAPFLLIIAIAVKCDSPGPVLYRRRVLGRGGCPFDAFKFRTMRVNGDEILARSPELQAELNATQKLKNDPRITRLGRILRKYSIDELPQLFNVLLGQMSLVGPRMIAPAEAAMYGKWKMNLLTVKPGLSGVWQISGRSDVSYEERIRLDMHYIRNYTLWVDFMILFRTIPVVVRGRGAY